MKYKHISAINVFSCLCVVIIHLTSNLVINLNKESVWYLVFFLINKLLTFAVPAFVFLSGYKLYNKYRDGKIELTKFYMNRFKKIVIPYLIAYVIYYLYFYYLGWVKLDDFVKQLILGTLAAHFYYIVLSIQFYALFPLFRYALNKHSFAFLTISFIITIAFNYFLNFEYIDRLFCTYILYFAIGMFASKKFNNMPFSQKNLLYISYGIIVIVHVTLCYKMSLGLLYYRYAGIGQVFFSIMSILLVYDTSIIISNKQKRFLNKLIEFIEPCTYNIYLYHILVINMVRYSILSDFDITLKQDFIINFITVFLTIIIYTVFHNKLSKIKYIN